METRKVQVTGGSTYTVSIPKTWANDSNIDVGDRIELHPEGDSMLLSPKTNSNAIEGTFDITGLNGASLTRTILTLYVSGFDVLTIETSQISADQRSTIRDATQGLVGFEVIEETSDQVVLQDLLDSSELSVPDAVNRIRLISLTMLKDALTALVENNGDLAHDVIERDDDVDRLWFMVARVFRSALRNASAAAEMTLSREACFDFHSSARQLERIADHAAKIAQLLLDLGEVSDEVADALWDLHDDSTEVIDMAMDALFEDDGTEATKLANTASERVRDIDEHNRHVNNLIKDLDAQQSQLLRLVVDSLSRCADYGGNIAETAMQKAAPRP
ncbi:histidine kinase [halophilic archaeon]|nr:histidine kinase [halophilic archaeon]